MGRAEPWLVTPAESVAGHGFAGLCMETSGRDNPSATCQRPAAPPRVTHPRLPIDDALPALLVALEGHGCAMLQAPPGAGKTTRVPLAFLGRGTSDRIVMLEPRRLAARAAAERMAAMLGEAVGATVGYRMRGKTVVSRQTRIEVVTEGILTRMIQSDPSLEGISTVIFDEFHERSLFADLGLALVWEARGALRPDLAVVVMSATLDPEPLARLLDDAPVVRVEARGFPVETRWLDRPMTPGAALEPAMADLICRAAADDPGGILAFLPGAREIRRTAERLRRALPPDCVVLPLYGDLPAAAQNAALAPAPDGRRKVVLATSIAETSLTVADVRVVVDAGRARRARFDPGSGMTRLVTERASRAEAEQRRGRAGRVAPGMCFRLWSRSEEGAMPLFAPPEIETADLTGLALDLAQWGAPEGEGLAFLSPPPAAALAEARALLADLGALDAAGRITEHGRAMAALPLHPRLAHMLVLAGAGAAGLAALLGERDPLRGASADLALRLDLIARGSGHNAAGDVQAATLHRIRAEAERLARLVPATGTVDPAEAAALAYPDRLAMRRPGNDPRYLLSGGRGARLAPDDPLAGARFLVATDLDGNPREAVIRQAAQLTEPGLRRLFADRIVWQRLCRWSHRSNRVEAVEQECLGALVLAQRMWPDPPPELLAAAALEGLGAIGLDSCQGARAARALQVRTARLRAEGVALPEISDAVLLDPAETPLVPWLSGLRSADDIAAFDLHRALRGHLGHDAVALLDRLAPEAFVTPLGRRVPIDYAGELPGIEVRVQELFGLARHPCIGPARTPLRITLLSPARRPVQVTTDLPGFWRGAYADVRKDMRGRYPRHPWPEDPMAAPPTVRANRKGKGAGE